MVFITAGLGGGTGTGASPVIAELCRKLGFYTIMVASLPFSFEGRKRNLQAIDSLKELEKIVDLSISFPNDKLRRLVSNNMTMIEVFKVVDQILINGIKSFTDLLNKPGIVKLNLADLIRVICNSGRGYMGTGISNGKNRAIEAAERAMTHPLFDNVQLINADKFIVNVSANSSLTLDEAQKAIERISTEISVDSNLLWGSVIDNDLRNELKISLIVAGLKDAPSNEINIRKRETESDLRRNTNK